MPAPRVRGWAFLAQGRGQGCRCGKNNGLSQSFSQQPLSVAHSKSLRPDEEPLQPLCACRWVGRGRCGALGSLMSYWAGLGEQPETARRDKTAAASVD